MKARRLIVFIASAIAVAAVVSVALTAYWRAKQPVFKDAPRLIAAMQAFSQDLKSRGRPLPPSVSLDELVRGGYLAASTVHAFDGMDVRVSTTATEDYPSEILISARLPDGSVVALLADGSVHQLSASGFEDYLKRTGQPSLTATERQRHDSETNQSSSTGIP